MSSSTTLPSSSKSINKSSFTILPRKSRSQSKPIYVYAFLKEEGRYSNDNDEEEDEDNDEEEEDENNDEEEEDEDNDEEEEDKDNDDNDNDNNDNDNNDEDEDEQHKNDVEDDRKDHDSSFQSRPTYPPSNPSHPPTIVIRLPPSPGSSPLYLDDNNVPYIKITPPPLSDSAQETARKREAESAEEKNALLRRRKGREGQMLSLFWVEKVVFW